MIKYAAPHTDWTPSPRLDRAVILRGWSGSVVMDGRPNSLKHETGRRAVSNSRPLTLTKSKGTSYPLRTSVQTCNHPGTTKVWGESIYLELTTYTHSERTFVDHTGFLGATSKWVPERASLRPMLPRHARGLPLRLRCKLHAEVIQSLVVGHRSTCLGRDADHVSRASQRSNARSLRMEKESSFVHSIHHVHLC